MISFLSCRTLSLDFNLNHFPLKESALLSVAFRKSLSCYFTEKSSLKHPKRLLKALSFEAKCNLSFDVKKHSFQRSAHMNLSPWRKRTLSKAMKRDFFRLKWCEKFKVRSGLFRVKVVGLEIWKVRKFGKTKNKILERKKRNFWKTKWKIWQN